MLRKNLIFKKAMAAFLTIAVAVATTGCGAQSTEQSEESTVQASAEGNEQEKEQTAAEKWGIESFNYVLIPGEDSEKSVQLRDEMCQALSEALGGIPVTSYRATDYNAAVEAMRTGTAQMAYLGPFAYVTAVERSGAECMTVTPQASGGIGYQSYIITRPDSGIESLADLEGKTFGFVDPSSTSGNMVPCNDIMTELGLDLSFDEMHLDGKFFSSVTYVGSHQSSLQGVIQGNVDAAAVSSNTYMNQIEAGNISESDVKIIHESAVIPGSTMCIQGDLPEELKAIVKDFLLNYEALNEETGEMEKKYIEVQDSDYDYVRELQEKFDLTD